MERMLEGIRVLDLTQAYSGPYGCMHLADHGAEVIKIEPLTGDQTRGWAPMVDGYSGYYAYLNRNKKGMAINLKSEEGAEILRELIKVSDVVIENFKAGTFAKLGFTYESMKEINPKIIYGQITGFGLTGPKSKKPCYDLVAQAESGMMDMTGFPENDPVKIGPSVADSFTGTYLALGIMMALFKRERTGQGSHVDVAMLDTMLSTMEAYVPFHTLLGKEPTRQGNADINSVPWDSYRAKDGMFVAAVGTDRHWQKFCEVLGFPEIAFDPKYNTFEARSKHYYGDLKDRIEAQSSQKTLDELDALFEEAGVPFGQVRTLSNAIHSSQTAERNMLWEIYDPGLKRDFCMPGTPIKFEEEEDTIVKAAPRLGEDNEEILHDLLNYDDARIKELKESGIIG